jgi:N utilization substance protein B
MRNPASKARARALQLLYAWEFRNDGSMAAVTTRALHLCRGGGAAVERAEDLAGSVVARLEVLDRHVSAAADNWRLSRIGAVERNILRIGTYELAETEVPVKVVLNEAIQLAHWFGGSKSPAFVNGVLDRVAHSLGRL